MTGIGGAHPAKALVAVEREPVGAELLVEEPFVGDPAQMLGPRPELLRPCVEPEPPGNPFGGAPGAIGIGLHLDHRDRAARKGTVGVKDGIAAVLPALIGKATLRPAMIFHE